MKIIFLDIDGVLNYMGSNLIDKSCLKQLRRVVEKTGAKIVLISTWKQFLDNEILKDLSEKDKENFLYHRDLLNETLSGEIEMIDIVEDYFSIVDAEVSHTTVSLADLEGEDDAGHGAWRSIEVKWWLEKHPEVESFVIIDDFDCEYHNYYPNNWVQPSWFRCGLSKELGDKAIKILNK